MISTIIFSFLYLRLLFGSLRPRQWIKNLLVFVPLIYTNDFTSPDNYAFSLTVFGCFCVISSAIYLFNDCIDKNSDKYHPSKKRRPIASGKISVKSALATSALLTSAGLWIATANRQLLEITLLYLIIQIFYSLKIKQISYLELFCISAGFVCRTISGCIYIGGNISFLFLLTIALLSLFVVTGKRLKEFRSMGKNILQCRIAMRYYSISSLEIIERSSMVLTLIFYSIWLADQILHQAKSPMIITTIPFLLAGLIRYKSCTSINPFFTPNGSNHFPSAEQPEEIFLNDKLMQFFIVSWLLTSFIFFKL